MKLDEIIPLMKPLAFFSEVPEREFGSLYGLDEFFLEYSPNDLILDQGEIETAFYVLLKGKLSVERSVPVQIFLAQLVPGSIFGEISMIGNRPRNSSVRADEKAVVFKIDQKLLDNVSPLFSGKIKDQIIKILVSRLDEVNNKLAGFVR